MKALIESIRVVTLNESRPVFSKLQVSLPMDATPTLPTTARSAKLVIHGEWPVQFVNEDHIHGALKALKKVVAGELTAGASLRLNQLVLILHDELPFISLKLEEALMNLREEIEA